MGLYVQQNSSRTELQERIARELREKIKAQGDGDLTYEKPVNAIESTTHESQNLGPVVILICAVVLLGIAYLLLKR